MLDVAFEAVDGEDVASREVVPDPGEKGPQAFRVGGRVVRSVTLTARRLIALGTDCVAERPETLLRTFEIGGHTLLNGASKLEEVSVSRRLRGSRVHPDTLMLRR